MILVSTNCKQKTEFRTSTSAEGHAQLFKHCSLTLKYYKTFITFAASSWSAAIYYIYMLKAIADIHD